MADEDKQAPVEEVPAEEILADAPAASGSRRDSKGSGQVSRKGSQIAASQIADKSMIEMEPQSPAEPPPAEDDPDALARKASKTSLPASRKGSQIVGASQLSRQASRQGSAVAMSLQGSRKGSALLQASRTSSQRGSAAAAVQEEQQQQEEDHGVDWRFNYQSIRKDLEAAKEKLVEKQSVYDEQAAEIEDLQSQLEAKDSSSGGDKGDRVSKEEVEKFKKQAKQKEEDQEEEIKQLQARVRRRDSQSKRLQEEIEDLERSVSKATDLAVQKETSKKEMRALSRSNTQLNSVIDDLKSQVRQLEQDLKDKRATAKSHVPMPTEVAQQMQELQATAQARTLSAQERSANIQKLKERLDNAQAAIVSATDQVWENDIKLAQARRALVMILENDPKAKSPTHGSPAR